VETIRSTKANGGQIDYVNSTLQISVGLTLHSHYAMNSRPSDETILTFTSRLKDR